MIFILIENIIFIVIIIYMNFDNIHKDWLPFFTAHESELRSIFNQLQNVTFYPESKDIFNAFTISPKEITVIINGQDVYHGLGQAHGYAFSVKKDIPIPPSLINIFRELNIEYPNKYNFVHGNLELWTTREKIFLLNSALTVLPKLPNSHANLWKTFTDDVIKYISDSFENKVFLLLGNFSKKKAIFIDSKKHTIIGGIHPSPLSAHTGFFNSNIFIKIDSALAKPINYDNN